MSVAARDRLPNKALQLTWHSAFQSGSGSILASTLGASAAVGGLCHAAERPVRRAALVRALAYSSPSHAAAFAGKSFR